ncbi:hypothetical protein BX600DRAFT_432532 [Xylariales sp. PMI_506]|nr:hypothetical protein BX600DRAFT_432532 [Xylariales sp. PMI_506]
MQHILSALADIEARAIRTIAALHLTSGAALLPSGECKYATPNLRPPRQGLPRHTPWGHTRVTVRRWTQASRVSPVSKMKHPSATDSPPAPMESLHAQEKPKDARIKIWRDEVNPSDVMCSCSRPKCEQEDKITSLPGVCWNCRGRLDEGSGRLGVAKLKSFIKRLRRSSEQQDEGLEREPTDIAASLESSRGAQSPPFQAPTGAVPGNAPAVKASASRTEMYQALRREQRGNDDATSVSSLLGAMSDSDDGRARPKLTIDDSAARLRRAQKLLLAQSRRREEDGTSGKHGAAHDSEAEVTG